MRIGRYVIVALLAPALALAAGGAAAARVPGLEEGHDVEAVRAADFILSLQNEHGAILDFPESLVANTDSHMQYALWGLATAYVRTGADRYLEGMRDGLLWLASRQRRDGSWWVGYRAEPPFRPKTGAYGVSATIGLFAYDVWLYRELGGDLDVVRLLRPRARAALRFLYERMRAPDGTFYSAFGRGPEGAYRRADYRFTSDQADVYLGLRAAADLFASERYRRDAARLRRALEGPAFFLHGAQRYAKGILPDGTRDGTLDILTVWPNGYVPWVLGPSAKSRKALAFLGRRQLPDGGFRVWRSDPVYSLSAEVFVMGTTSVYGAGAPPEADRAARWLAEVAVEQVSGGIVNHLRSTKRFCNIAGFGVLSWLRSGPLRP